MVTVNVAFFVPESPSGLTVALPTLIDGCVTVIGAVSPVGRTLIESAVPAALLKYVPGVLETVTPKCSVVVPLAGTLNDPVHVSSCPLIVGFAVVAPVVEPGVYVNPAGRVSTIDVTFAAVPLGFVTVIV